MGLGRGSVNSEADDDDTELFRAAVRDVKPLSQDGQVVRKRLPSPRARFTRVDRHAVLRESLSGGEDDPALASGEELVFHRPGIPATVLKKLRRGQYRVQAEIDLHGMTVAEAKHALRDFLVDAL